MDATLVAIEKKLSGVIDPETGVDVLRMRLVQDLSMDTNGVVYYTFRPSSPICPLAVPLALMIHDAIEEVPGVTKQKIRVVDFAYAQKVTDMINQLSKKKD